MAKLKTGRHTGALKAQRQAVKRTSQNKGLMKKVRVATKTVLASLKAENIELRRELKSMKEELNIHLVNSKKL